MNDPIVSTMPVLNYEEPKKKKTGFGSAVNDGTLSGSKSPLDTFLAEGAANTPEAMRARYASLFDANKASFGGPSDVLSGALAQKLQANQASSVNDVRDSFLRNSPFDYAKQMGVYQDLSDMRSRRIMASIAAEKQRAAERQIAKKQTASALLGTGGAIAGGIVGGPAGAAVGGGLGTIVGSR